MPYFYKIGCKFEVDEMFIKIANDKKQNWLINAIEQKTKHDIGFIIGSRNTENMKSVINKLHLLHPKRIYTDRLNTYPSIIPKEIRKHFQFLPTELNE
uniref:DDE-type integrase/transposase/recombinase n=1 Tax=Tenacibaculum sediminilitoris TaxID=1820334 RepID=UPI0038B57753